MDTCIYIELYLLLQQEQPDVGVSGVVVVLLVDPLLLDPGHVTSDGSVDVIREVISNVSRYVDDVSNVCIDVISEISSNVNM